ncbi:EthD domain-containing protein [Diaphorobacter sp. HDW4B]|uniref:EthD domain-containing protein n=1 Tax=Diaphorobacter sp. HDW4B TaxID=2714925 RepID=UPI00140CC64C|nr:EthD domain-containing protein [Diaphorobacter sp. HDW4B]QIL73251.1 EthD domain-containing protein [Diaphorobacter sp. HDW4B]
MTTTVWKMIYLARRNPAFAPQEFPEVWRSHSALGKQCVNVGKRVKAVAQCSRVLDDALPATLSRDFDGVNLMVLADRESGNTIWNDSETLAVMRPDEPRVFADYVRNFSMLCQQHVLRGDLNDAVFAPRDAVILVGFLQRESAFVKARSAPSILPESWRMGALDKAYRMVCNTLDEAAPQGYGFGYIVEWWFESLAEASHAASDLSSPSDDLSCAWGDSVFLLTKVTHSRP